MKLLFKGILSIFYLLVTTSILQAQEFILRDNFERAQPGDYLVITFNKTQTLMHICEKKNFILTIEEISVPEGKRPSHLSWREWVMQEAPNNTSWTIYNLDLRTGQIIHYYSFTKKNWFEIPEADNFLSKLFNLKLFKIPDNARKRMGSGASSEREWRHFWQPRMIVDGKPVEGIIFDAWKTKWPKDGSELSGKTIEIYLPQKGQDYPSYFPYWLQINGVMGKAKIRVIDSGKGLKTPKPCLESVYDLDETGS